MSSSLPAAQELAYKVCPQICSFRSIMILALSEWNHIMMNNIATLIMRKPLQIGLPYPTFSVPYMANTTQIHRVGEAPTCRIFYYLTNIWGPWHDQEHITMQKHGTLIMTEYLDIQIGVCPCRPHIWPLLPNVSLVETTYFGPPAD